MVDKAKIVKKLDEMMRYIGELEQLIPSTFKEYTQSLKEKRSCERTLQLTIEAALDVVNIINSNLKLGLPKDEEDSINNLAKKGIISKKIQGKLIGIKGIRNHLVHKYGEIKDELVYVNLKDNIEDFDEFRKEILDFLKKK